MRNDDGANLPIPSQRNQGAGLEVYHSQHQLGGPHPWRQIPGEDDDLGKLEGGYRYPPSAPERTIFNLSPSTFILSCALLVVTAGLIILAGLLGSKIANLENTIPSLTSAALTNNGSTTAGDTDDTSSSNNNTASLPVTAQATAVAGWTYLGCVYDSQEPRTLNDLPDKGHLWEKTMTNEYCGKACKTRTPEARHFGTQIGNECYCGTITPNNVRRAPEWMCNRQCPGRSGRHEDCGGNWVLSVWERDD